MSVRKPSVIAILLAAVSAPAIAQSTPPAGAGETEATPAPPEEEQSDEADIVVVGRPERGAVVGDIPPEVTLDARDIRAYGAGSLSELLDALAPQTQSARGRGSERPVILLNGRRISGFAEIRNLPPEALERVDILPEEVALKYGYRADQRVVNFVLRERFRAVTAEVKAGVPTAGGRGDYEADGNFLRLRGDTRLSLDAQYQRQTSLLESERNIVANPSARPFDLRGNIGATTPGAEIDPALSAQAGQAVTIAAVPAGAAGGPPPLSAFVAGANAANVTDTARYRTLLPSSEQIALGATYSKMIFGNVGATVNARLETTASDSRLGLPEARLILPAGNPYSPFANDVLLYRYAGREPLGREADGWTGHLGIAMNGDAAPWRWSFTGSYDHAENRTLTDRGVDLSALQARIDAGDPLVNPYAVTAFGPLQRDRAKSNTDTTDLELVLNGALFSLPAGNVSSTIKAGLETRNLSSQTLRAGVTQERDLSRQQAKMQANVDIPIASRRNDVWAGIGNLSANLNVALDQLSDFGSIVTYGGGINWSPIEQVRIIASVTKEDGAPTIQQLGDPNVLTPNVRVFDFATGETVDISRLDGGNSGLLADNRRVFKLGLNVKPIKDADLTLTADFIDSRVRNPIASFPTATREIEAAFPDRFVRDSGGRLIQIDNRPVNFARADQQQLRWGINFSEPLEPSKAERAEMEARRAAFRARREAAQAQGGGNAPAGGANAAPSAGGARGGGRGGGFGGRGFGGRGGGGAEGRLQFSLYHSWRFKDEVLIRDGVPVLDLLGGSATGSRGGQSRHEIEAQAGVSKNGLGARITANWQSATRVLADPASPASSPDDLFFSDFTSVGLRLFADLGQQRSLVSKWGFLRGSRVSLSIDNLFDARIRVRDREGTTPINYQPDLIDPLGRTVRLSFRKLFF